MKASLFSGARKKYICRKKKLKNFFFFSIFQLKAVYSAMKDFCELPEESRSRYERNPATNHGYVKPGMERYSFTIPYRTLLLFAYASAAAATAAD